MPRDCNCRMCWQFSTGADALPTGHFPQHRETFASSGPTNGVGSHPEAEFRGSYTDTGVLQQRRIRADCTEHIDKEANR